ncbi:MAG: PAS domain S-box protein, partial [Chloroflexi bacterium]|nr:PAS domain S-box protein [Chloroflexota bacterium]
MWDNKPLLMTVYNDITEQQRAIDKLQESEERYRHISSITNDITYSCLTNKDGIYSIDWFAGAAEQITGYTIDEIKTHLCWRFLVVDEDLPLFNKNVGGLLPGQSSSCDLRIKHKNGEVIWITSNVLCKAETKSPGCLRIFGCINDINKSKILQKQQNLTIQILEILNKHLEQDTTIRQILMLIKEFSGCEAVGIRLKQGEDFPYYETNGFVTGHVEAENHLCAVDAAGDIIRDSMGNPYLECMCGNIICGRFDPEKPFFTKNGSFWSNCTSELLVSTTEKDRQARTRNKCNGEGYESVALIPLKTADGNIGLLQLNDSRRNRFTPALMEYYEGIAQSIGVVLVQIQAQEALQESELKYRTLFETIPQGITYQNTEHKIIGFNNAALRILGLTPDQMSGRTSTDPQWKAIHEDGSDFPGDTHPSIVALQTGQEVYNVNMGVFNPQKEDYVWININAKPLFKNGEAKPYQVYTTFNDITKVKQAEIALRRSELNFRNSLDDSPLGIGISNDARGFIYANRALLDIWEYPNLDELNLVDYKKRYTTQSCEMLQDWQNKRNRGEAVPDEFEISIITITGEIRYLNT